MRMAIPALTRLERRDADMHLTWDDGTIHEIRYDDLRHACPCANCSPQRNSDDSSFTLRQAVDALAVEKPTVRPTGNYALVFEWTTGCSSGIYRFERIWRIGENEDPDQGKQYVHGAW